MAGVACVWRKEMGKLVVDVGFAADAVEAIGSCVELLGIGSCGNSWEVAWGLYQ